MRKKNIYGNIFTRIYILLQKYKIKKKNFTTVQINISHLLIKN